MTAAIALFALIFVGTWIGVEAVRRWTLRRNFLDVPNDRSSHSTPTPRGGGLVIVLFCLLGYSGIALGFNNPFAIGYIVGALLIAGVSWLDDLYSLPFWSRLIVHISAALILVLDAGFWHVVTIPVVSSDLHLGTVLGIVLTVGWLVWLVNAYNFMDGIDGIAGLQAVIAGLGWAIVLYTLNLQGTFLFAVIITSASAGFLVHNWQPAKIFMGDVGSSFLGFTLGALPLLARHEHSTDVPILPLLAVLFVWLFVFDSVFTLVRRMIHRERVWEAHRQHIYQRMVIGGMSHSTVALIYGGSAAILSLSVCLSVIFVGNYAALTIFSLLALTLLSIYFGFRKQTSVK